ncbi:cytosolic 5'-nucleotidase III-like [Tropilaelaps mercedesae]|uniref:5'-nucleotidase n=1 Tax=Tropilaelaps mercedesae TaxID=418985 RepID=A0A1V9XGT0_9ACAR|nr:cytosolic 5'-nucleotidase III-like [Tropilaelaps mercedesae]
MSVVRGIGRGLAAANGKPPWLAAQINSNKVHVKDAQHVQQKIDKLAADGSSRLQLLTDFDRTLSRTHYNGKPVLTSYCVYDDHNFVTPEHHRLATKLREKYYPIEISPKLTAEEKMPHMIQWFAESFDIILKAKINIRDMPAIVRRADLHLRCDTVKLCKLLAAEDVPILVFSAGLGDVVRLSLQQQGALLPNVTVLSNFIEYDKQGVPLKFSDQLLHIYNKNAQFPPAVEYFASDRIRARSNAVLMGDSLGDCSMADGAPGISLPPNGNSAVLRIGFLDHDVEQRLESYVKNFDIVLVDDQTMKVPLAIFRQILTKS